MNKVWFTVVFAILAVGLLALGCTGSAPAQNNAPSAGQANGAPAKAAMNNSNASSDKGMMVGNDRDAHGCIPSAGYSWCAYSNSCIRPWETPCLRVLTESFPPLNYLDENGQAAGQSSDVVRGIMNRTNQTYSIELMEWNKAYNLTLSGKDVALYSVARTPERESLFKWVGPIGSWEFAFYVPANSTLNISSLDDARSAGTICAVKDDARAQFLAANNFTNLDLVSDDTTCARELQAGADPLWMGSTTSFSGVVRAAALDESQFSKAYTVSRTLVFIAFSPQTDERVVDAWQNALDAMQKDRTFADIVQKYNVGAAMVPGKTGAMMPGSDHDAHGCIPSAGYEWCQVSQKCIRPWEENCTAPASDLAKQAQAYCNGTNVAQVAVCGPYIKVVSDMPGAGSTYYSADGTAQRCPIVAPDVMSPTCRMLMLGNNCVEQVVCDRTQAS
ncbi:Bacterial extracellular solute-binding proteins, family 3 [uncultured archaeon]|nr:Bacterial extracellular solute-binding proteins, family 3 [uncultured archaeon]